MKMPTKKQLRDFEAYVKDTYDVDISKSIFDEEYSPGVTFRDHLRSIILKEDS